VNFLLHRLRTQLWTGYYYTIGRFSFAKLGKGVRFEGWIDIPQRGGKISIGDRVHLCRFIEFSVPHSGELWLGSRVFVGRGVVVSAHKRVSIGAETQIAEYVMIHDNDHRFLDSNIAVASQGFSSDDLSVGCNCWIGAGATLLRGAAVGANAVIGAGSVVTRPIPARSVAVGVPCAVLKLLSPEP
jgi:acetyltransferase-like isoleucine patch superfamily enzyme